MHEGKSPEPQNKRHGIGKLVSKVLNVIPHLHEHGEKLIELFKARVFGKHEQGFDTGKENEEGPNMTKKLARCNPGEGKVSRRRSDDWFTPLQ